MKKIAAYLLSCIILLLSTIESHAQCCDELNYYDPGSPCWNSVCGYDEYCCNTEWDSFCVSEAVVDDNCQLCLCNCFDLDQDGFTDCQGDCNDFNEMVNPGMTELCGNGLDDDCDGIVDNAAGSCDKPGYTDLGSACAGSVCNADSYCCDTEWDAICAGEAAADEFCEECWCGCHDNDLDGYTNCEGDCDDFDIAINPGAEELCSNGVDEDCDGIVDNAFGSCDAEGYTDLGSPCAESVCLNDPYCCDTYWDAICAGEAAADDDCQSCWCGCYDNDLDGYTNCEGDCDDFDDAVNPGMTEVCSNGKDDNCDGYVDNVPGSCDQVGYTNLGSDCAFSVCIDDPYCCDTEWDAICAGEAAVNEFCQECWCGCYDNDLDGYTNCDGDCEDFDEFVHPGIAEVCNGIDDNCDGLIDEGLLLIIYLDDDGDSYGDAMISMQSCEVTPGYVTNDDDCDDGDADIHPGATEVCNGYDDDCDGSTDEGVMSEYWLDADGDGYGNPDNSVMACDQPMGRVDNDQDCDDTDENVNPDATETCNGLDDNCNDDVDEDVLLAFFPDLDGDGYGGDWKMVFECAIQPGLSLNNDDCDDDNADVYPGATEVCNLIDDDCNGQTDDNCGVFVQENSSTWDVALYPNPVDGMLTVSVNGSNGLMSYSLIDQMGREISRSAFIGSNTQQTIDCSGLSQGLYTFKLYNGTIAVYRKFLKL